MNALAILILLQIVIEVALLGILAWMFYKFRRSASGRGFNLGDLESSVDQFLKDSQALSAQFSSNLAEKKELSLNLLLKLERKINEMRQLMEQAEKQRANAKNRLMAPSDKNNPAAPEARALALKLAAAGLSAEEIAKQTKLYVGEVELILDLEKK